MYKVKAEIYPEPDGTFAFDNVRKIRICKDKHDVGANLEQDLWPLVEPMLSARKSFTIIVTDGTN